MTTIWYMVPEISTATDRFFWSSLAIFFAFTPLTSQKMKISQNWKKAPGDIIILHKYAKNHDHRLYCLSAILSNGVCRMSLLFFILNYFLPFHPPNSPNNENIKKKNEKKTPRDIIILHYCAKTHDHRLYCSWDMVHGRCNYFPFWAIFCHFAPPLPPLNLKKWKYHKIEKSTWGYHHFTEVYQKSWSQALLFLRYGVCQM